MEDIALIGNFIMNENKYPIENKLERKLILDIKVLSPFFNNFETS
jgi:hypothetical protein